MRVVFMGTPDFAATILKSVIDSGHEMACVYSQPPRQAGRGMKLRPSPVHARAAAHDLPVRTPKSLRKAEAQAEFAALQPDIAVVAAYGLILPQPVLDAPRLGCINLHASILPRWRGAAPIQRAIMAGDTETGITVMQMEAGLDIGPMLMLERVPITPQTTAGSLHDQLAALAAEMTPKALAALEAGTLTPVPQPAEGVTYAEKISKAEARIDWRGPAPLVDCHIRGLSPVPGAWCEVAGERVKVLFSARADGAGEPGSVLDDRLTVACGTGAVRLLTLQRAGKKPMGTAEFLRGQPLPKGTRLD